MLSRDLSALADGLGVWRRPDGSLCVPAPEARLLLAVIDGFAAAAALLEAAARRRGNPPGPAGEGGR